MEDSMIYLSGMIFAEYRIYTPASRNRFLFPMNEHLTIFYKRKKKKEIEKE